MKHFILLLFLIIPFLSIAQNNKIEKSQISGFQSILDSLAAHRTELDADKVQTITIIKSPLYEYREIWAEESGNIANNNAQWSYGNGDLGAIGIPFTSGWEITEAYIQADNGGSAAESLSIIIEDFRPSASGTDLGTFSITAAGDGQDNNASSVTEFTTPIPVPDNAVLGFRTGIEVGNWNGLRVGLRARRQIGEYVSDIIINP